MMKTAFKFFMAAALLAAPASGVARDADGPDLLVDGFAFDFVDYGARTVKVTYNYSKWNAGLNIYEPDWGGYTDEEIIIPSQVDYYGTIYDVVEIGEYAFSKCSNVKSVYIPEGVKTISSSAFSLCTGLTSINIPESVTSLSLEDCTSLTSIDIPEGVTSLDLIGCRGLTSVDIPEGVTSLDLRNCTGLTSIDIPEGVTSLDLSYWNILR